MPAGNVEAGGPVAKPRLAASQPVETIPAACAPLNPQPAHLALFTQPLSAKTPQAPQAPREAGGGLPE